MAEKSNACINFGINCDASSKQSQSQLPVVASPQPAAGTPVQHVPIKHPPKNHLLDAAVDPVTGPSAFAPAPRGPVPGVEVLTPDESVSYWKGPAQNAVPKATSSVYLVGGMAFAAGLLCGLFFQHVCYCCCRGANRQPPPSNGLQQPGMWCGACVAGLRNASGFVSCHANHALCAVTGLAGRVGFGAWVLRIALLVVVVAIVLEVISMSAEDYQVYQHALGTSGCMCRPLSIDIYTFLHTHSID
jgi:hypothetical protein